MVAYRKGNRIDTYPLQDYDYEIFKDIETSNLLIEDFYPRTMLYKGVNLRQPMKHGLDRVDKFYTSRNLIAMSQLWMTIHRIKDVELASFMAFVFTSLYQRVTKLSEYRFWGGSGNVARFNVPYIFKEANVFTTFERKSKTIHDHLVTTSSKYSGTCTVVNGSATKMLYLPDKSVDLIFTDPPFGSNINYSEMNILWEAWLDSFTNTDEEAIVNNFQRKNIHRYKELMTESFQECWRVLKPCHWMLVVFMNSSTEIWDALRKAIQDSGFRIVQVDIFDKQHSSFKQLVSENTVGSDLVIHCQKCDQTHVSKKLDETDLYHLIIEFLNSIEISKYRISYIHVNRNDEIDYSRIYAEWTAIALKNHSQLIDFSKFRKIVADWLSKGSNDN
jgi:16S rRNA G966 N2-methylase RsmD